MDQFLKGSTSALLAEIFANLSAGPDVADLFLICGAEVARALFSVESNHRIGKAAPVLELRNVSLSIEQDGEPRPLIADVTTTFPRSHFAAILGPSGCGKSTLLKVITGIAHGTEEGHIYWDGRDLIQHDFSPSEIGYVPQFSIAHEDLTVRECVSYSIKLRVRGMGGEALEEAIARILEEVNMTEIADRLVARPFGWPKAPPGAGHGTREQAGHAPLR